MFPWRRAAGVAGPVVFIAAWSVLGERYQGYSPVHDPISRLAAVDAPSRWAMTAGFVAFGALVSLYGAQLRVTLPGPTGLAAAITAVATIGIAVTPLGSALGGTAHSACAGVAYGALAATPLLGGRSLAAHGRRAAGYASMAAGVVSGASLLASALSPELTGLFQRVGLTVGDAWIVATALAPVRQH
ncbi:hypothetical protein BH18ACT4_BH18ACT4_10110 [soil metagenome]